MRTLLTSPRVTGPLPVNNRLSTDFNGSDEYGYKTTPTFENNTQGSVLVRLRLANLLAADGNKGGICGGRESGANNVQWSLGTRRRDAIASGVNRLAITTRAANAGTVNAVMGSTNLATNTWYSVIFQSSGTAWSIYLNDVAETLTAWAGSNNGDWIGDMAGSGNKRLAIGSLFVSNAHTNIWDGLIDEVVYLSRVLTSAERTEWYNGGKPKDWWLYSFANAIQAYYYMGDIDDDSALNDAVSTNNLTLVNITAAGDYVTTVP